MEGSSVKTTLLNGSILLGSLVVTLLLYAFIAGTLIPAPAKPPPEAGPVYDGTLIQVEVLNGCGVAHIAERTRSYLIDNHFDVISMGNYTDFNQPHSIVIDRVGNMQAALKVAEALGIPEKYVTQEIRPDYYLDASVILGKNFATLKPFDAVD